PALTASETGVVPFEEESISSIPVYLPDQPLPASALDGYVLDEEEVLNAIAQVDTQSVEQESQVLEAVEAISTPASARLADDEMLEDGPQTPPTSVLTPSVSAAPKPVSFSTPSIPPSNPSKKNSVKHGFY
ncbi:MAG TPA: hypothetical protein VIJ93_14215, partial [bacterium]